MNGSYLKSAGRLVPGRPGGGVGLPVASWPDKLWALGTGQGEDGMTYRTRWLGVSRTSPAPPGELLAPSEPPGEPARSPGPGRWMPGLNWRSRLGPVPVLGWLALVVAVVVVGLALFVTGPGGSPNRSGLPWASGVYPEDGTPAGAAAFAAWRGRPLDVVDAWSARATWAQIDDPTWLYQRWRGQRYTMAFGVPMIPEGVPGVSLQACANGAYDAYWREFGQVISSYGLGNSIIRLGWEFNGTWYAWKATDPTVWARCWQQIVTAARATAPNLRWDWDVNRGVSGGLANPALAYPGNAYVSMIGVDSYDSWPAATTTAGWQTQLNGPQGLNYWLSFAKAHGKLLSVPEWGNVATGAGSGGDDPQYVTDMRDFFAANAADIAFECSFQGDQSTTGASYGAGTSIAKASAAYKAGF
jgi:Glycosyl hydrolase family 26